MRLWLENADVALLTVGDGFLLPAASTEQIIVKYIWRAFSAT